MYLLPHCNTHIIGIPVCLTNAVIGESDPWPITPESTPAIEQLRLSVILARLMVPVALTIHEMYQIRTALALGLHDFVTAAGYSLDDAYDIAWLCGQKRVNPVFRASDERLLRFTICAANADKAPGAGYDGKRLARMRFTKRADTWVCPSFLLDYRRVDAPRGATHQWQVLNLEEVCQTALS